MKIKSFVSMLILACCGLAWSADYPSKPITLVVPAGPGGGTDILARAMGQELGKRLKQTVIVVNKTGASGMIGTQAVARAAPDGYTLLFSYSAPVYYARHMYAKVPYDVTHDLAVLSEIAANNLILVVNKDVPVKNMKEFVAWAKQGNGKLSYGSIGTGSAGHLAAAYLNESRELGMVHVPYKSEAPFAQDLAAGIVPWGMGTLAPMLPFIQSGKVRPIAALADERLAALPDVPTMKEQGFSEPELRTMAWFVLAAPAHTPKPILEELEKQAREIARSPLMLERFKALGLDPVGGSAADFRKNYEATGPVIEKLVRISGARKE